MKEFYICVEGMSFVTVQADTDAEAIEAAKDMFSNEPCDCLNVSVLNTSEVY
jgi:hypothetical protein